MKRALLVVIAIIVVVVAVPARHVAPARAADLRAVDWSVDVASQTITITARLDFYGPPCSSACPGSFPSDEDISRVVSQIQAAWGGKYFKCFRIEVKIDFRRVGSTDEVRDNAVGVELIPPGGFSFVGSHTEGGGPNPENWLGDSPAAADTPNTGPVQAGNLPTQWWAADPGAPGVDPLQAGTWAHEFGHIMGLDDNYKGSDGTLKDGAEADIMFRQNLPVSEETIVKAMRRSGQVDESQIKCPLVLHAGPSTLNANLYVYTLVVEGLTLTATACDYDPPSTDPARQPKPIEFNGTATAVYQELTEGQQKLTQPATTNISFTLAKGENTISIPDFNFSLTGGGFEWSSGGLLQATTPMEFSGPDYTRHLDIGRGFVPPVHPVISPVKTC